MKKLHHFLLILVIPAILLFSAALLPTANAGGFVYPPPVYNPAAVAITGGTIGGQTVANVAAVAAGSAYNPAAVAITGGTMNNVTIGAGGAANGTFNVLNAVNLNATTGSYKLGGKILFSVTAPAIASGFGASPVIAASNGTAFIKLTTGSGGFTGGVLTFPTAATGWSCVSGNARCAASGTTGFLTFMPGTPAATSVTVSCLDTSYAPVNMVAGSTYYINCTGY